MGTDIDAVPVTGLVANFSPIERMAPPPEGIWIVGAREPGRGAGSEWGAVSAPEFVIDGSTPIAGRVPVILYNSQLLRELQKEPQSNYSLKSSCRRVLRNR